MKVFQELRASGKPDQIAVLVAEVEKFLTAGWSRNKEHENNLGVTTPGATLCCFECTEDGERPAALLWLVQLPDSLRVSNIIPIRLRELSMEQYNRVLVEFYTRFFQPSARRLGIESFLSKSDQTLEDWAESEVAKNLRFFAETSNKSTGATHPSDREKWYRFIVSAHKMNSQLSSDQIQRWLSEEAGWPFEQAQNLSIEYSSACTLLEYYDRNR